MLPIIVTCQLHVIITFDSRYQRENKKLLGSIIDLAIKLFHYVCFICSFLQADKGDLESKVSVNQFDESFSLLDRGLSDALEKMESQMSIEDALKETLQELQSKLHLKLDRQELDSLRDQLESRIREVQVVRATVKEKPADDGEPAGFRR